MQGHENSLSTIPRLSVLVGKGGVGRSTMAAAMGIVAAGRGRKTLVIEVVPNPVIPGFFGIESRGYEPVECAPNLWVNRVTWEDALREYGLMKLRFEAVYRLVFQNPFVRNLLSALPGIPDILVMGKVIYAAGEGVPGMGPVDCVILDAPATGHGIALVRAPTVVAETVPTGPLAEDSVHLSSKLADPAFTRFHIVTVPEEMPIAESVEIYRALGTGMGLSFGQVLLNQVGAPGLVGREVEALSSLMGRNPPDAVCATAGAALFMSARSEMQRAHVHRLRRNVPLPILQLPDVRGKRLMRERLDVVAQHLDAALWREAR